MNLSKFVTGSQAWIANKYKNLKHKVLKYSYFTYLLTYLLHGAESFLRS